MNNIFLFIGGVFVGVVFGILIVALITANRTPDNDKTPIDYEERDGNE